MQTKTNFIHIREFLLAIGFSSNLLAYLLGNFGLSKVITSVVIFLLLLLTKERGFRIAITYRLVGVFAYIFALFLLSFIAFNYAYTHAYFLHFVMYSFFALFAYQNKLDFQKILEYLAMILFISIPLVFQSRGKDIGYLLGISYNFLVGYLATIFYLFFVKNRDNLILYIICVLNFLIYTYFYLFYGNRGAILLVIIYLFLKWFLQHSRSLVGRFLQLSSCLVITVIFFNWVSILNWLNALLYSMGISIHALDKTIDLLLNNQNVDSGRNYLIEKIFNQVQLQELVLGKGIGYIETTIGIYSHNLFIQSLFEGGILFFVILVFVVLRLIGFIRGNYKASEFVLIATIAVFGQLMLSNVYWLNPLYWFLFYVAFYPMENLEVVNHVSR